MNNVKNEFRSLLTQEKLNACMSLGMTSHSVYTFPFHTFLKKKVLVLCPFFIFLIIGIGVE